MLHEAIRQGCEIYHQSKDGCGYDRDYKAYREDRSPDKWSRPQTLDFPEVDRLILFVNQWDCHVPRLGEKGRKNIRDILEGLKPSVQKLNLLNDRTLLDANFDGTICEGLSVRELIKDSFNEIAGAGCRYEDVATSKMLNAAVNSELFVMWDNAIHDHYARYKIGMGGHAYAYKFLPKMQKLANQAIEQVVMYEEDILCCDHAIEWFIGHCKHKNTLAKIIDEYNFVIASFGTRYLLLNLLSEKFNVSRTEIRRQLFG